MEQVKTRSATREQASAQFGRFFLPGPTEVRPEVLGAQAQPMIGHREDEMHALGAELQHRLKALFRTERSVFVGTCSATGFMEAAIRNGARRRVLALVNGAFSKRFHQIAAACGMEADALEVPWGQAHDPADVERALKAKPYDAVTVVHSETSTGVLNPLAEIAWVVRPFDDVMLLVDTVSSLAGAPVHTDEWRLDFVLTGSQKALALPPGLALGVASARLMERAAGLPNRGAYFDLIEHQKSVDKNELPNTPAISLLFALHAQLRAILEGEGLAQRWERHRQMAVLVWNWVDSLSSGRGVPLSILAPPGHRSPTVTCIRLPEGRTGPQVVAAMRGRGYTIGAGYGKLKNECIRIGHMGDHTAEEVEVLLEALEEELAG
ncbi:MAG: alanine--glyoxylate aminotransferase family protein [Gemmatimonadetes bacterium]|nr:alanine--glyoxylate aminotransferase family protein [Gemmatimonadota bacterium]